MTTSTVDLLVSDYLERLNRAARELPADRRVELIGEIREHIDSARAAGAAADEAAVRTLLDRLGEPEEIVASAREDVTQSFQTSAFETASFDTAGGGSAGGSAGYPPQGGYAPAASGWSPTGAATETMRPSTTLETWAVVMLTLGSLIPVVGWLVGVVLLWLSTRWRIWEKLLGTLVVPFGPGLVLIFGFFVTSSKSCVISQMSTAPGDFTQPATVCSSSGPPASAGALIAGVVVIASILVAVLLLTTARRRAQREPGVVRPALPPLVPGSSPWGGLEIGAVVALGAGSFVLPVIGPLVGLVLAWSSRRWTDGEKTIATVIATVPVMIVVAIGIGIGVGL